MISRIDMLASIMKHWMLGKSFNGFIINTNIYNSFLSQVQEVDAIYSNSQVDNVKIGCLLELHIIAEPLIKNTKKRCTFFFIYNQ